MSSAPSKTAPKAFGTAQPEVLTSRAGPEVALSWIDRAYDGSFKEGLTKLAVGKDEKANSIFLAVQNQFDQLMEWNNLNEFSLNGVKINVAPKVRERFNEALAKQPEGDRQRITMLWHGTYPNSVAPICRTGFSDKKIGSATDDGWYGKGHYFTPNVEYAVAYCENNAKKKKKQVRRLNFKDAVDVGTNVSSIIGCFVIQGETRALDREGSFDEVKAKYGGRPIDTTEYDSHAVLVDANGAVTSDPSKQHAQEVVIPTGALVLPFVVLSLTRVNKVVLWRDPNLYNEENTRSIYKVYDKDKVRASCACCGRLCPITEHPWCSSAPYRKCAWC